MNIYLLILCIALSVIPTGVIINRYKQISLYIIPIYVVCTIFLYSTIIGAEVTYHSITDKNKKVMIENVLKSDYAYAKYDSINKMMRYSAYIKYYEEKMSIHAKSEYYYKVSIDGDEEPNYLRYKALMFGCICQSRKYNKSWKGNTLCNILFKHYSKNEIKAKRDSLYQLLPNKAHEK